MLARFTILFTRVRPWLGQTSTIAGISALVGLMVALFLGDTTWQMAIPVAVGAIVAMALPGNVAAGAVVAQVAVDAIKLARPDTRAAGLRDLTRDVPIALEQLAGSREPAEQPKT